MKAQLEKKRATHKCDYTFQQKAWCDERVLLEWLTGTFVPLKNSVVGEAWCLLFLDAFGKTHSVAAFKEKCFENRVLCWYGEPNTTHLWQPIDAGMGKTCKDIALGDEIGLGHWLEKKAHRKLWTRKLMAAQLRRSLSLQFVGDAWLRICTADADHALRQHAWERTGCLLTATGEGDALVAPQGFVDYSPPAPGSEPAQ